MVFRGLLDPDYSPYVRVLAEHSGMYDGLWLPRVTDGHACVRRVDDDHELQPPRPRTPVVKGPLKPEVKAAWEAYFEEVRRPRPRGAPRKKRRETQAKTKGGDDDPEVQRWRRQHGVPDPNSEVAFFSFRRLLRRRGRATRGAQDGKKAAEAAEAAEAATPVDHPFFGGGRRGGFGGGAPPGPKPSTTFDDDDSDSSEGSRRE